MSHKVGKVSKKVSHIIWMATKKRRRRSVMSKRPRIRSTTAKLCFKMQHWKEPFNICSTLDHFFIVCRIWKSVVQFTWLKAGLHFLPLQSISFEKLSVFFLMFYEHLKTLNVLNLSKSKTDEINRMITITGSFFMVIKQMGLLKCDHINWWLTLSIDYIKLLLQ